MTICPGGVNFAVHSKRFVGLELLLFDSAEDAQPTRVIRLNASDPNHRKLNYWHVFVPDIKPEQVYGCRADGPLRPDEGLRYDRDKVLLDPYGRGVAVPASYDRGAATKPGDNATVAMKSVVVDLQEYDWEGDRPLFRPFSETVIYEMHLRGFTHHPSSGVAEDRRGIYLGVIKKISCLKALGITAVELLPVFLFDEQYAFGGLTNYWGYNPISFF